MNDNLMVSLEPHLVQVLTPLRNLLPQDITDQLDLSGQAIPFQLLQNISQWARTVDGTNALSTRSLEPAAYSMVSLLAGTTTSPDRHFPAYDPPKEPEQLAAERAAERKAITSLINALLSVIGCGVAAWWASANAGWRDEWRALFAMFVAIAVAVSETILYMVWKSARTRKTKSFRSARHKKNDGDSHPDVPDDNRIIRSTALRQRILPKSS